MGKTISKQQVRTAGRHRGKKGGGRIIGIFPPRRTSPFKVDRLSRLRETAGETLLPLAGAETSERRDDQRRRFTIRGGFLSAAVVHWGPHHHPSALVSYGAIVRSNAPNIIIDIMAFR